MVRRLGQITKIGWGPKPVGFSLDQLITKSATLQGTYGHHWGIWDQVLRMMQRGKINFEALISDVLPITEWERSYAMVESRKGVKVILTPVG
jgi:alcohol dehydrogenase/L-iditol 2-dehydrogenase